MGASPAPDPSGSAVDRIAVQIVRDFNAGDAAALVALYGTAMSKALPLEKTAPLVESVRSSSGLLGTLTRTNDPDERLHGTYRVKAERGDRVLDVHIDEAGSVTGMHTTHEDPPPPVQQSRMPMSLPFRGKWFVSWGGDTAELNRHISVPSQRRATDLVMKGVLVTRDGATRRSDSYKPLKGDFLESAN